MLSIITSLTPSISFCKLLNLSLDGSLWYSLRAGEDVSVKHIRRQIKHERKQWVWCAHSTFPTPVRALGKTNATDHSFLQNLLRTIKVLRQVRLKTLQKGVRLS